MIRSVSRASMVFVGACALAWAAPAQANPETEDLVDDVEPSNIYQGEETQGCGWPTTVAVTGGNSLCTGTLIHPEIVAYAAHCGGGSKTLKFGNSSGVASKTIKAQYCRTYEGYGGTNDQGHDWAFCRLNQPVTDLPITPIVMGCEGAQYLTDGAQVAIVGFGNNSQNETGAGTKRWAMTTLHHTIGNIAQVGGAPNAGICSGDSGGPAFVQYEDGSWHAFGIASTVTGGCSGLGTHALLPAAASWIEEESGLDVTPCFTLNGQWDPDYRCGHFITSGAETPGEWGNWCSAPVSGASSTCGAPYDEEADTTAPVVTILDPIHEMVYEVGTKLPIEIDANDGGGWGVKSAWVSIEGMEQDPLLYEPYKYGAVQFPEGAWTLKAYAEDGAGNIGESSEVVVYIGVEPGETGESESGSDSGSDGDPTAGPGDDDDDDSSPSDDDDDDDDDVNATGTDSGADTAGEGEGCGCRADDAGGGALTGFALLGLLALGRRRRR